MNHRRYTYFTEEDILLLKRRYTSFLKETHRSLMRSGMGALLLMLLLLTACVGEELQKPLLGEGEGYLTLQIGAISAEVTSSTLTKATLENLPDTTEFSITIKGANNTEVKHYEKLSQIENPLVLKAGVTYTVEASHGKNEALQDTPYFYDSKKVTIQANTNNQVTVNASLANAMIIPVVTESLKNHYENNWKLTASVGETSLLLASAEAGIDTLYAHADSIVSLTFTGKNKAGQYVSFKWTDTIAVKACKAYMVQCNPDLSAFKNIQVTATATHTKDSNGDLNGTDVTFNADINDEYKAAIDSFKIQVFNSNQQVIRTYTGNTLDQMTYSDTDWPYIPQGSTLSASVKLKAGDEITVGSTFALPAPDFVVAVSAQTSYSVYSNPKEGAAIANTKNGSSIFNIGSTVKISNEILTNSNYANILPKVTYTTDTGKSSGELAYNASVGDFTDLAWQKHVLTATASFDGAKAYASKECEVTGLPYSAKPPKKAEWSGSAYSWRSDYVRLHINTISKTFYVPQDININIYEDVYVNRGTVGTTFQLSVSDEIKKTITPSKKNVPETDKEQYEAVLKQNNPIVSCINSYGNPATAYYEGTHAKIYEVTITYR